MHQTRFERISPEEAGLRREDILALLCELSTAHPACEVHALSLLRHGRLVFEGAFSPYRLGDRHEIFSITKMLVGTAVGFAEAEGLLSLTDRVAALLPDCLPKAPNERLSALTVEHLLTMTAGFATHGVHDTDILAADGTAAHKARAILSRPMLYAPGACFGYDNNATYLLSLILLRVAGMPVGEYLTPRLFAPMGIPVPDFGADAFGVPHGYMGVRLSLEELSLLGQLYLDGGMYRGRQLLPRGWVARATASHIATESGVGPDWCEGYGYQLWRGRHGTYRFCGAYGQMCVVMPALDAVFTVLSGADVDRIHTVLDAFYARILLRMTEEKTLSDRVSEAALSDALRRLSLASPALPHSLLIGLFDGRRFPLVGDAHFTAARPAFTGEGLCLYLERRDGGTVAVEAGSRAFAVTRLSHHEAGLSDALVPHPTECAAALSFPTPAECTVTVRALGTPFVTRFTLDLSAMTARAERLRFS